MPCVISFIQDKQNSNTFIDFNINKKKKNLEEKSLKII